MVRMLLMPAALAPSMSAVAGKVRFSSSIVMGSGPVAQRAL